MMWREKALALKKGSEFVSSTTRMRLPRAEVIRQDHNRPGVDHPSGRVAVRRFVIATERFPNQIMSVDKPPAGDSQTTISEARDFDPEVPSSRVFKRLRPWPQSL